MSTGFIKLFSSRRVDELMRSDAEAFSVLCQWYKLALVQRSGGVLPFERALKHVDARVLARLVELRLVGARKGWLVLEDYSLCFPRQSKARGAWREQFDEDLQAESFDGEPELFGSVFDEVKPVEPIEPVQPVEPAQAEHEPVAAEPVEPEAAQPKPAQSEQANTVTSNPFPSADDASISQLPDAASMSIRELNQLNAHQIEQVERKYAETVNDDFHPLARKDWLHPVDMEDGDIIPAVWADKNSQYNPHGDCQYYFPKMLPMTREERQLFHRVYVEGNLQGVTVWAWDEYRMKVGILDRMQVVLRFLHRRKENEENADWLESVPADQLPQIREPEWVRRELDGEASDVLQPSVRPAGKSERVEVKPAQTMPAEQSKPLTQPLPAQPASSEPNPYAREDMRELISQVEQLQRKNLRSQWDEQHQQRYEQLLNDPKYAVIPVKDRREAAWQQVSGLYEDWQQTRLIDATLKYFQLEAANRAKQEREQAEREQAEQTMLDKASHMSTPEQWEQALAEPADPWQEGEKLDPKHEAEIAERERERQQAKPVGAIVDEYQHEQEQLTPESEHDQQLKALDKKLDEKSSVYQQAAQADEFTIFMRTYPKPSDPVKTRAAWDKLVSRGVTPQQLVQAAQAYAAGKLPEERYIPQASSWLERGMWQNPQHTSKLGVSAQPFTSLNPLRQPDYETIKHLPPALQGIATIAGGDLQFSTANGITMVTYKGATMPLDFKSSAWHQIVDDIYQRQASYQEEVKQFTMRNRKPPTFRQYEAYLNQLDVNEQKADATRGMMRSSFDSDEDYEDVARDMFEYGTFHAPQQYEGLAE